MLCTFEHHDSNENEHRHQCTKCGIRTAYTVHPPERVWNLCRYAGLGDCVQMLLLMVGITPQRWRQWTGQPCGCIARQARLNKLLHVRIPFSKVGL